MADLVNKSNAIISSSGGYAGNDTANRAIPHGLGRIPSNVYITLNGNQFAFSITNGRAEIVNIGAGFLAVTAPDATNFYVGNAGSYGVSANAAGSNYSWSAV